MPFAILTGASRGIGAVLAHRLSQAGYTVACIARSEDDLAAVCAHDPKLHPVVLDLADPDALDTVVDGLLDEHGPCALLVNNAGYGIRAAVEEIPMDRWQHEFQVNVFAATRLCQKVLPGMRAQRGGVIVQMSSVAGRIAPPFNGAYAATKFALEGVSDALRREVARFGIHVVLVEPGPVSTDFAAVAAEVSEAQLFDADSPYAEGYSGFREGAASLRKGAWTAEQVADATMAALAKRSPPQRVACYGPLLHVALGLHGTVPRVFDKVINRQSGADKDAPQG